MSEKLTKEIMRECMEKKLDNALWVRIEADREAIREETRAEVTDDSLQSLLTRLIRWNDVKSTHAAVLVYDEAGTQIQSLGRVPRPKVKRKLSDEDLIRRWAELNPNHFPDKVGIWANLALNLGHQTIRQMYEDKGLPTEVDE